MRMIVLLLMNVLVCGCNSGTVPPPHDQPLSGDLAIERIKKTGEYRQLEQSSSRPLIMVTDATGEEVRVEVQQDEGDARLPVASFRAARDGRVYVWDDARSDWRVVAIFD